MFTKIHYSHYYFGYFGLVIYASLAKMGVEWKGVKLNVKLI